MFGGGPDECNIRANQEGLILFALKLMEASSNFEEGVEKNTDLSFDCSDDWYDEKSDIHINYIEPVHGPKEKIEHRTMETNLEDKIVPFLFMLMILSAILIFFLGLQSLFE